MTDTPDEKPKKRRAPRRRKSVAPPATLDHDDVVTATWSSWPKGRAPVKKSPWPPPLPPLSDEDVSLAAIHARWADGYVHAPVKQPPLWSQSCDQRVPLWRRAVGYLILALVLPLVVACVVVGAVEWTLQSCGHWMLDVRERIDPECAP